MNFQMKFKMLNRYAKGEIWLDIVELPVPLDEIIYSSSNGCVRTETDIFLKIFHVGRSGGDIAFLHREEVLFGLFAQTSFQSLDVFHEFHGLIVADVI